MSLYPNAEQVPWKHTSRAGLPTYYSAMNRPEAVVLHRMQGWAATARQWAMEGHYGASWHYTVGLDGHVMQHLLHRHGGYHAGIVDSAPRPGWLLWKGRGINVNHYTIGVECEGFAEGDWPDAQLSSLRDLCRWLAGDLGIAYDRAHFPPHADIDIVNRVNDFDTPERRDSIVYPFLFEQEDEVSREEYEDLLLAGFSGSEDDDLDRAERIRRAQYRVAQAAGKIAGEPSRSVLDIARSASETLTAHTLNHGTETIPPHDHLMPGRTGGVA